MRTCCNFVLLRLVEILKYSLLSAQVCLHKYDDFYDIICLFGLFLRTVYVGFLTHIRIHSYVASRMT